MGAVVMIERKKWKRWPPAVKREAVERVLAGEKPSNVATEIGCTLVSLYEWLRADGCISRHTCQWVRP